jgi:DnaJ homolog subfamily B member 4
VIDEKPHARYTRNGNDIVITQKMTLADALTNKTLEIPNLDGRILLVQLPNVVTPDYEHKVANEGMPITKQPRRKGTLKIKFDISIPQG